MASNNTKSKTNNKDKNKICNKIRKKANRQKKFLISIIIYHNYYIQYKWIIKLNKNLQ